MKTAVLTLFSLVFAITLQSPFHGAAGAAIETVVDTSGKKLRADANYYIIPAVPFTICSLVSCSNGGGLTLDSVDDSCPLDVVIEKANEGLPLTFTPYDTKKTVIRVSTDLNIRFSEVDQRCANFSTVWKVDDSHHDGSVGQRIVTTGGALGNPGENTILNWFKIEKFDDAYKLVYCPTVCPSCKPHVCKDLGMFVDSNKRKHLATSDEPFKVKFQKA
ncbi:hypothetical protein RJT34_26070 [Clitoria ternatea]|uniref:Miraculin n=1 Tax=Clitoria ternatea TaxID=43366 RepID=A0AAN9I8X7_CLITE